MEYTTTLKIEADTSGSDKYVASPSKATDVAEKNKAVMDARAAAQACWRAQEAQMAAQVEAASDVTE